MIGTTARRHPDRHRPARHERRRRHAHPPRAFSGACRSSRSTVYDDDDNVFDAICAGASGYLLKNTPPARLLEVVAGSRRRRRADVARTSPAASSPFSASFARRNARRLSPDAAGDRSAQAHGRRASLQDGGGRDGDYDQHGVVSSQTHLRKTAGPFQDRGRVQGLERTRDLNAAPPAPAASCRRGGRRPSPPYVST